MAELFDPVGPPAEEDEPRPLREKLAWFFALALGGALAVAAAAYILRAFLFLGSG